MQNRHESIIRAINNSNKKYNILTFPTHERYQSNLGKLDHTFYLYQGKGIKPWSTKYGQLPKNHILLDGTESQIKPDMKFDIVLSQNKYGQYQTAKQISSYLNLPLVSIEHTLPFIQWTDKHIKNMTNMRGDIDIFISEYSIEKWQFNKNDPNVRIIEHGIDTSVFKPIDIVKKNHGISCVNDFQNRDWCCGYTQWLQMTKNINTFLIGDTPGLSLPAKSVSHLVEEYNQAICFINSSIISPIPTAVLEAMACGLPVITLNNCMLPEIIKDGVNGFISNDISYLRERYQELLTNPELASKLGRNAQKTISQKFSLDVHLQKWQEIFNEVYGRGHKY